MHSIWDLANQQLRDFAVYEPGKPIEETARELGVQPADIIKLASNENPLGPSPKAVAAMREAINDVQLYPDGAGYYLRTKLAEQLRLAPENIILGNGSNEIIEFLGHAFLGRPEHNIVVSQYAFIAYQLAARLFNAPVIEVPTRHYAHDLEAMLEAITPQTRLVFIANPNNPTGTLASPEQIDRFIDRVPNDVITVIDEAYYEFLSDRPDTLRHVREGRNVVVLRTFSKIHGLASLRVGYGMAPAPLIEVLQKTREPFNVNGLGQVAALAALSDDGHKRASKQVNDEGRAWLENELNVMFLQFVPGAGNFIMVNVGDGPAIFRQMLERKIIVRPLRNYGLTPWVRISIGTMEQNRRCLAALRETLSQRA